MSRYATTSKLRDRSLSFDGKKESVHTKCTLNACHDTLRQANFAIVPYRSMVKKCTHKVYTQRMLRYATI